MATATSLSDTVALFKKADHTPGEAFAGAVNDMAAQQLKSDAMKDVRNMALASLGIGLAGRGGLGLYNLIARNKQKKLRGGPAMLPLPYPVEGEPKLASFLAGDMASTKPGIPWYGPAMLTAGLGGLAAGWGGMDSLMDARRKAESQAALDNARNEFRQALLSQYSKPLAAAPKKKEKQAEDAPMEKVGAMLDSVWDKVAKVLDTREVKEAVDWSDLGGMAAGGYGTYAGLSGLLTGALVFNQMKKRSRQAVMDKALAKRDRRRFMQSPTEIYAVPEPMEAGV